MRWLGGVVLLLALALPGSRAHAQYRNYTFGLEAGYLYLSENTELKPSNVGFGLMGGYKSSDKWWFNARALITFPGQLDNAPNTVVMLSIVPIEVRYYLATDAVRPYVGVTNSFQLLFNHSTAHDALWGPGVTAGVEFRLQRDMFLGFQADGLWMLVFEGPDAQIATLTSQLIFFL